MKEIEKFFNENFEKESLEINKSKNLKEIKYFNNAKADAVHCYRNLKKYIKKNHKILEVGGGIHLLTSFLNENYNITSIEPGSFANFTDKIRNKILNKKKLNVHTTKLENLKSETKFDFIFSMNVLEHTDNIEKHLLQCINLLKNDSSILFIQCPNYTFPFEPHFYKWFIPFFPGLTFKYLRKKNLIRKFGFETYKNTIDYLNFDCSYFKIKKLKLSCEFIHPLQDIFDRLENDMVFRERLFKNSIVKNIYKIIIALKLNKLLIKLYPIFLAPYLIMKIKKNTI